MKVLIFLYTLFTIVTSQNVKLEKVVDGFNVPLDFIEDPLGGNRKFVVEKKGKVYIVKDGNKVNATPFLDMSKIVSTSANEGGLLSIAFHPKYKKNGFFFIYYTEDANNGNGNKIRSILRRLRVSPDNPDIAIVGKNTKKEIFWKLEQPFGNHNGGQILFGPNDNYLYVFLGDGGSGGDPNNNAQDLTSLFGKILRIKPKTNKKRAKYKIPKSNPFKKNKKAGVPKEIYHYGVRNPWRNSFDKASGDLFIGDVGQNKIEEISIAKDKKGGLNFGWRLVEGDECFEPSSECRNNAGPLQEPILTYEHNGGDCSVTGGYVYRGTAIPGLVGKYIYGDFCSGTIRVGTSTNGGKWSGETLLNTDLGISSFGEDKDDELYVVDYFGGGIYKIVAA